MTLEKTIDLPKEMYLCVFNLPVKNLNNFVVGFVCYDPLTRTRTIREFQPGNRTTAHKISSVDSWQYLKNKDGKLYKITKRGTVGKKT